MGDERGTDDGHCLGIDVLPCCRELMPDLGHRYDGMKDDQVADEMSVRDELALLIAPILGEDALATEEQPLEEPIERLALVPRASDRAPQFCSGQVLQQERGADHPSQFAPGKVHAILATLRS
jgi:hypothetical protein